MMQPRTSQIRWALILWIFILSAVSYLDRVNISIAGTLIADAYHLSNVQLGSIFSALVWGYALFQTLGGRLADKFGPRRALTGGVIWWGVFTALTAAVPGGISNALFLFIVVRFLLGAGEAVVYPASNHLVARWIPTQERGLANGLIFAGVGVGAGLSPPLITYLMLHFGWRASFWACAIIGLIAGLVWYLVARDTPEEHPRVSAPELAFIHSGLTFDTRAGKSSRANLVPWRRVFASKEVLAVTLSYFCFGYVAWIFFSWFYIYLAKVRGLNLKASAFYAMLPFLAMAIFSVIGGKLSDRLTRWRGPRLGRCVLASAVILVAGAFLAFGAKVESARLASVVLAGGAGALYLSQSSFWSVTADIAGRSSGSVSGFMNMGGQIGGAVTAQLTPWIADKFGWTASFLVAASLCVLGSAAWLLVDPKHSLIAVNEEDSREPQPDQGARALSSMENAATVKQPGT